MSPVFLPQGVVPNGATPSLVSRGGVMGGASDIRVNRLGDRYRLAVTLPPLPSDRLGRLTVARLIKAQRTGIVIPYPLLGVDQSHGVGAVVDGAGQAGTTLSLRGLYTGVTLLEGFWLSIEDAGGQHFLHNVSVGAIVDAAGKASIEIEPMLRRPFADGARVHIVRPMIQGFVEGDERSWSLSLAHHIGIEFSVKESA